MSECALTSLPACCDWGRNFEFSIICLRASPLSSETEREIAPLLFIRGAFPKVPIARTRHEPYIREGVLVLDLAWWLLGEQGF